MSDRALSAARKRIAALEEQSRAETAIRVEANEQIARLRSRLTAIEDSAAETASELASVIEDLRLTRERERKALIAIVDERKAADKAREELEACRTVLAESDTDRRDLQAVLDVWQALAAPVFKELLERTAAVNGRVYKRE